MASGDVPGNPREFAAFARDRDMPRQSFAKSPLERKPMYVDVESPALTRILCRHAGKVAAHGPRSAIRFTDMLPTPEQCWLSDPEGNHYVSSLTDASTRERGRHV
jgi:hypothetical protein